MGQLQNDHRNPVQFSLSFLHLLVISGTFLSICVDNAGLINTFNSPLFSPTPGPVVIRGLYDPAAPRACRTEAAKHTLL